VWLPPRRPRALAVEIHDSHGRLAAMQASVSAALAEVGKWEPPRGRFRAHITLARMREGALGGARARPLPATPQLRFTPATMALYRSWLSPEGASYEAIATCALAEPDA
jgi:RNA 2',3'-cyclic 3'-phosphodiesterase